MFKNIDLLPSALFLAVLFSLVLLFLFRRERKKKNNYRTKYFEQTIDTKKSEAKTFNFVSARNAINYIDKVVYGSFQYKDKIQVFYIESITAHIEKSLNFKDLFNIFNCFEINNKIDQEIWNFIKDKNPQLIKYMEKIVLSEVEKLKSFSNSNLAEDEKIKMYLIVCNLEDFIRKNFIGLQKGTPLEANIISLKKLFSKNQALIKEIVN
ncbi:MAG: hypothetical protein KBC11_01690 [Candidatus Pacebacteria bacterium]|nr:hypothetical protein [Candidatus Paceibacterota bacterium]